MTRQYINWRTVYRMLAYAVEELARAKIGNIDFESCKSLDDLLAALMCNAIQLLNSNNYLSEYNNVRDITDKPQGNILINESYDTGEYAHGRLVCEYFKLNINSIQNRVIKSAIQYLAIYGKGISKVRKAKLLQAIEDLHDVDVIDREDIDLSEVSYEDLPDWYRPAIVVSRMIIEEMISTNRDGNGRAIKLDDVTRLKYIFEKFVRNFYIKEYNKARTTRPVYKVSGSGPNKLDMLLENDSTALIIDTKWYERESYSRKANERQALDYAISYREHERNGVRRRVEYIVLYATSIADYNETHGRSVKRDIGNDYGVLNIYEMGLNINQDFEQIKSDLISMADKIFNADEASE